MQRVIEVLRSLGSAGAVANARAELESAHDVTVQAAVVACHVNGNVAPLRVVTSSRTERSARAPHVASIATPEPAAVPLPQPAGTRVA